MELRGFLHGYCGIFRNAGWNVAGGIGQGCTGEMGLKDSPAVQNGWRRLARGGRQHSPDMLKFERVNQRFLFGSWMAA